MVQMIQVVVPQLNFMYNSSLYQQGFIHLMLFNHNNSEQHKKTVLGNCEVSESVHVHPVEGHWKFSGGVGHLNKTFLIRAGIVQW